MKKYSFKEEKKALIKIRLKKEDTKKLDNHKNKVVSKIDKKIKRFIK